MRSRGLHFGGGGRHHFDNAADGVFELIGQFVHGFLALDFGVFTGLAGLFFKRAVLDHVVLEDFDRAGHVADFIAFAGIGDGDRDVAIGQFQHHAGHAGDGHGDGADHDKADDTADQRGEGGSDVEQEGGVFTERRAASRRNAALLQLIGAILVDGVAQGLHKRLHGRCVDGGGAGCIAGLDSGLVAGFFCKIGIHAAADRVGKGPFLGRGDRGVIGLVIGFHALARIFHFRDHGGAGVAGQQDGLSLARTEKLEILRQVAEKVGGGQPVLRDIGGRDIHERQALDGKEGHAQSGGQDDRKSRDNTQADRHIFQHSVSPGRVHIHRSYPAACVCCDGSVWP